MPPKASTEPWGAGQTSWCRLGTGEQGTSPASHSAPELLTQEAGSQLPVATGQLDHRLLEAEAHHVPSGSSVPQIGSSEFLKGRERVMLKSIQHFFFYFDT